MLFLSDVVQQDVSIFYKVNFFMPLRVIILLMNTVTFLFLLPIFLFNAIKMMLKIICQQLEKYLMSISGHNQMDAPRQVVFTIYLQFNNDDFFEIGMWNCNIQ